MFSKLLKCNLPIHCTFKFYLEFISKDVKRVSKKIVKVKKENLFFGMYIFTVTLFSNLLVRFHFTDLDHKHLWHGITPIFIYFIFFSFSVYIFSFQQSISVILIFLFPL